MSDLLQAMAETSAARLREARTIRSEVDLLEMADAVGDVRFPQFSDDGFDIIAEVKLRSPSEGTLASFTNRGEAATARARAYEDAGAVAVSVLTEPIRFNGDLEDLATVREVVGVPVMRKDFLVDPYQVVEARAHGADGVLLIAKLLSAGQTADMIDVAHGLGMWVLLESFDEEDIGIVNHIAGALLDADMVGINSRNLRTLDVEPARFAELIGVLPNGTLAVAESGVNLPADASRVAALGYGAALVGTALMRSETPGELVKDMITAGRAARRTGATP